MDEATLNVAQRVLAAYGSQRDDINDSDLDNEQPISLSVYLTLGDIRKLRMMVRLQGKNPADFRVRASSLSRPERVSDSVPAALTPAQRPPE